MTLLPSPFGGRCPAGADEGASESTCIAFFEMGEATRIEFQRGFARTLIQPLLRAPPALAARALQGTRANGAQTAPSRLGG
ncbi:hypothetical protein GGR59_000157 [Xanthomonas arboricola]|nr:hypothetical protein [Xanthomonas arboricola]